MNSTGRALRPRKTPQQQRAWATRERILTAAARVFARHGYAAGTTDRIAAAAKLSIGSLYQYFPNKDAILVALTQAHLDEAAQSLRAAYARIESGPVPLAAWLPGIVGAVVTSHGSNPRLHQVLFQEAPHPPELLERLHQAEHEAIGAVAGLLSRDPELRLPSVVDTARLVVATIESLTHWHIGHHPEELDAVRLTGQIVALLSGYLRNPQAAGD